MARIVNKTFVQKWWDGRVRAGSQLSRAAKAGDARGEGPWYRTVSIGALYADYRRFESSIFGRGDDECHLSRTGFMMVLRSVLPEDIETIYARIQTPEGQIRQRCLRFRPLAAYRPQLVD